MFSMIRSGLLLGALAALEVGAADSNETWQVWNEGVAAYEAGDVTNAVRLFRSVTDDRRFAVRAEDAIAKIEYDRAHAEGAENRARTLEESALAAQQVLKASKGDARAERNFTRTVDAIPELRETEHYNAVVKESQGKDPAALLKTARDDARKLLAESTEYTTNAAPVAVALADKMEGRALKIADAWIPVKEFIAQAVTNEAERARVLGDVDGARIESRNAAKKLGDLDESAFDSLSLVEDSLSRYYQTVAMPPEAIYEDYLSQSNQVMHLEPLNGRPWQREALVYTRCFEQKFDQWAEAYAAQAQSNTNMPPFTAETRSKIKELAAKLDATQTSLMETPETEKEREAMKTIEEIMGLMPRPPQQGQNGQNQQQPQDQKDDSKNEQQKPEDQDQNEDQGSEPQEKNEPQANDQPQQDEESAAQEPKEDPETESILKRAQERTDEHEAQKKARMRNLPSRPNERDW